MRNTQNIKPSDFSIKKWKNLNNLSISNLMDMLCGKHRNTEADNFNHATPHIFITGSKSIDQILYENKVKKLIVNSISGNAEKHEKMSLSELLKILRCGSKLNPKDAVEICLYLRLFDGNFTQDILLENFNAHQQHKKISFEIESLGGTKEKRKI